MSENAQCLNCGHVFSAGELAAMVALDGSEDCVIDCSACGAHNVVRTMKPGGLEANPRLGVIKLLDHPPDNHDVFDQTVNPGVRVHPKTSGKSD